jgi:hypothetical protein
MQSINQLTVAQVPAAGVIDAWQTLQLQEVLLLAAELAVAALLRACDRGRVGFGGLVEKAGRS